jgi:hypothetical protein
MGSVRRTANCFAAIRVIDEHFRAQISLAELSVNTFRPAISLIELRAIFGEHQRENANELKNDNFAGNRIGAMWHSHFATEQCATSESDAVSTNESD